MEILKTSKELTAAEKYFLTMSPEVKKMKDTVSQEIEIKNWCLYKDTNGKGEEQTILSIQTPENEVFATNSPTFTEDFLKMQTMFAECSEAVTTIKVTNGISKAGREFITCVYVA